MPVPLSVLFGRQAGVFFKHFGKIALVLETGGKGDIDNRIICVGEKPFALFDPDHIQVLFEGGTGGLLEYGGKIGGV